MADSIIEVNTVSLKSDVETMQGCIKSLRTATGKLQSTANQLGNMWEGNAKKAFMAAVQDDLKRLEILIATMEKFTGKTDDSRTEYEKCESTVDQIIASIQA